ncbi:MAG: hypothetical protein F6K42_19340 [Leptolyngbya sp. SIO1D8]|nr:hypothetical protein [Leptolyngbya sp. SIO1D8]
MVVAIEKLMDPVLQRLQKLERSLLLCILAGVWLGLALPGSAIAATLNIPIDQARQQPDGVEVMVTGIVTVPSGHFASANLDQGFAIQDQNGGIYVSTESHLGLQAGQTVQVVGTLQDDGHGQRVLSLKHWQADVTSSAVLPSGLLPQSASVQEAITQLDGKLVTVQGTITRSLVDDAPYGDRLWLADDTGIVQIYIPRSTGITPQELRFLKPGQEIQVTGFSSQYDLNDEVMPRWIEDVRLMGK